MDDTEPILNENRELYREDTGDPAGSFYENSVFVTPEGQIGMNVGGLIFINHISEWHKLAEIHHRLSFKS